MTHSSPGIARPLDWQETFTDRGDGSKDLTGWEAETHFGTWYSVEQYFGSDSYAWHVKHDFDVVADCDDPDQAQAAAQADFEKRVRAVVQPAQCSAGIGTPPALAEGIEILVNLTESIKKHGNYTSETTRTFIGNALQCFWEVQKALKSPNVAQPSAGIDDATCYVERSAVRMIMMARNDGLALRALDELRIFTAADFINAAQSSPAITDEMVQSASEIYSEVYSDDDKDQGDAIRAVLAYALSSTERGNG